MELNDWLRARGLGHLEGPLRSSGIDLDVLADLTEADLTQAGLNLGDRKRLMKAIAAAGPAAAPSPAASPAAALPKLSDEEGQRAAVIPPPPLEAGERRQITVMFCDLVGSTRLAEQLDPEDLRRVVQAYYAQVNEAVRTFEGHVAQLLGDGVMVYFGYPQAHEDDAVRAVHAALAAIAAVAQLQAQLGLRLQCRIGIATGPVVLGWVGTGTGVHEVSVTGRIPNLAARLQASAQAQEIVVSPQTRALLGDIFELVECPPQMFKGIDEPVTPWRVQAERSFDSRFATRQALGDLVGRSAESSLLFQRWSIASEGETQVVLLTGEAGIGKSRLLDALRMQAVESGGQAILWQCSPHHSSSMLWPVIRQLERKADFLPEDPSETRRRKLARAGLDDPSLIRLLGIDDLPSGPHQHQDAGLVKVQSVDAVVGKLRSLAQQSPLLLLVEDAHWIDPSTQELLVRIIEELDRLPLMILVTARPEYRPGWDPRTHLTSLSLSRLSLKQASEIVAQVTGAKPLPESVVQEITRKTDGVPLFVEELTKAVLESGALRELESGYVLDSALPALAIPATLQDSLMARLDRLASAREVAQVGAVIGRDFGHQLLAAVLAIEPVRLNEAVGELIRAELVFRKGAGNEAVYSFKHALVRDAAYQTLLRSQRPVWHARVAQSLQELEPQTATLRPELLAYHLQEAGLTAEAVQLWTNAAQSACDRAALAEADQHAARAIALAPHASDPTDLEWRLQMLRAQVLTQREGYGSTRGIEAARRAADLARATENLDRYVQAACCLATFLVSCGRLQATVELFAKVPDSALLGLTPSSQAAQHWILGVADYLAARVPESLRRLECALELIRRPGAKPLGMLLGGVEPEVAILLWLDGALERSGHHARSVEVAERAHQIAERSPHPPTKTWCLQNEASLRLTRQDTTMARQKTEDLKALARKFAILPRMAAATMLEGHLAAMDGDAALAKSLLQTGFDQWVTCSPGLAVVSYAAAAANRMAALRDLDGVAHFLNAGEACLDSTEVRIGAADLLRLRAWLHLQRGERAAARDQLLSAVDLAKAQGDLEGALRACREGVALESASGLAAEFRTALRDLVESAPPGAHSSNLEKARQLLAG